MVYTKFSFYLIARYIYYKRVSLTSAPFFSFILFLKYMSAKYTFEYRKYSRTIDCTCRAKYSSSSFGINRASQMF